MKNPKLTSANNIETNNVSILSNLKPAATKLILQPEKVELIELIKLTFLDLSLKQVLIIKKEFKKLHPKDPYSREYLIVETGKNFKKYNPDKL